LFHAGKIYDRGSPWTASPAKWRNDVDPKSNLFFCLGSAHVRRQLLRADAQTHDYRGDRDLAGADLKQLLYAAAPFPQLSQVISEFSYLKTTRLKAALSLGTRAHDHPYPADFLFVGLSTKQASRRKKKLSLFSSLTPGRGKCSFSHCPLG
jgi:hypothetical protein